MLNDRGFFEVRWTERGRHGRPRSRSKSTRSRNVLYAESFLQKLARDRDMVNHPTEAIELLAEIRVKLDRLEDLLRSP